MASCFSACFTSRKDEQRWRRQSQALRELEAIQAKLPPSETIQLGARGVKGKVVEEPELESLSSSQAELDSCRPSRDAPRPAYPAAQSTTTSASHHSASSLRSATDLGNACDSSQRESQRDQPDRVPRHSTSATPLTAATSRSHATAAIAKPASAGGAGSPIPQRTASPHAGSGSVDAPRLLPPTFSLQSSTSPGQGNGGRSPGEAPRPSQGGLSTAGSPVAATPALVVPTEALRTRIAAIPASERGGAAWTPGAVVEEVAAAVMEVVATCSGAGPEEVGVVAGTREEDRSSCRSSCPPPCVGQQVPQPAAGSEHGVTGEQAVEVAPPVAERSAGPSSGGGRRASARRAPDIVAQGAGSDGSGSGGGVSPRTSPRQLVREDVGAGVDAVGAAVGVADGTNVRTQLLPPPQQQQQQEHSPVVAEEERAAATPPHPAAAAYPSRAIAAAPTPSRRSPAPHPSPVPSSTPTAQPPLRHVAGPAISAAARHSACTGGTPPAPSPSTSAAPNTTSATPAAAASFGSPFVQLYGANRMRSTPPPPPFNAFSSASTRLALHDVLSHRSNRPGASRGGLGGLGSMSVSRLGDAAGDFRPRWRF